MQGLLTLLTFHFNAGNGILTRGLSWDGKQAAISSQRRT